MVACNPPGEAVGSVWEDPATPITIGPQTNGHLEADRGGRVPPVEMGANPHPFTGCGPSSPLVYRETINVMQGPGLLLHTFPVTHAGTMDSFLVPVTIGGAASMTPKPLRLPGGCWWVLAGGPILHPVTLSWWKVHFSAFHRAQTCAINLPPPPPTVYPRYSSSVKPNWLFSWG